MQNSSKIKNTSYASTRTHNFQLDSDTLSSALQKEAI